jgi:hypothetical protein
MHIQRNIGIIKATNSAKNSGRCSYNRRICYNLGNTQRRGSVNFCKIEWLMLESKMAACAIRSAFYISSL